MFISIWFTSDGTAWVTSVDAQGRKLRSVAMKGVNLRKVAEMLHIRNEWSSVRKGLWRHRGVIVGPMPAWLY